MKNLKRKFNFIVCILLLMAMVVVPTFADEISDAQDLEDQNGTLEDQVAEEKARLAEIQENISSLEDYIQQLDEEMNRISNIIAEYDTQMSTIQVQIDDLNSQIESLKADIEDKNAQIEDQYSYMKLRIQFMYENVSDSAIESILSAGSFSEAIEKAVYFLDLAQYDKERMEALEQLVEAVEADETQLQSNKDELQSQSDELESLKSAQEAQQEIYEETQSLKQAELSDAQLEADEAQAAIDSINSQIAANQDQINSLVAAYDTRMAEEAAAATATTQAPVYYNETTASQTYSTSTSSSGYGLPLPEAYRNSISSWFGYRNDPDVAAVGGSSYHQGIDFYAPVGTTILAIQDGTVIANYWNDMLGYVLIIYHGNGVYSSCFHQNQQPIVSVGSTVVKGQVVGYTGATGTACTGPHLHFALGIGSATSYVDPAPYLGLY